MLQRLHKVSLSSVIDCCWFKRQNCGQHPDYAFVEQDRFFIQLICQMFQYYRHLLNQDTEFSKSIIASIKGNSGFHALEINTFSTSPMKSGPQSMQIEALSADYFQNAGTDLNLRKNARNSLVKFYSTGFVASKVVTLYYFWCADVSFNYALPSWPRKDDINTIVRVVPRIKDLSCKPLLLCRPS